MARLNIELPTLNETDFQDKKAIRALRDYMYVLSEQLSYTLSHLDGENLSDSVQESISASVKGSEEAKQGVEECRAAIHKTDEAISLKVQKGEIISEINQSAEEVKIQAEKIALEGVVTANEGFKINLDGSMEATAGSLGAFSVDAGGNLAGAATLQVGGMTFSGNRASGLQISADNLDYVYGQPYGSETAYILGISDNGRLCLFDLLLSGGQLQIRTPGDVPQSSAAEVLRITARGDGLKKRAQASTGAATLGSCASGEVYGYSGTVTDAQGHLWARCTSKYSYDPDTALWTASGVGTFFIRQHSDGYNHRYYDFTTVNV